MEKMNPEQASYSGQVLGKKFSRSFSWMLPDLEKKIN